MLFEQVPHWCGMMSRIGRFGKASAAPPVAGEKADIGTQSRNVRFVLLADIEAFPSDVRFSPQSDTVNAVANHLYVTSVKFFDRQSL